MVNNTRSSILGVLYESRGVDHEDNRRALLTAFNGDLGSFVATQVKFAVMKQDAVLGGHYHTYDELFYLLEGQGTFSLRDTRSEVSGQNVEYQLVKGDRLFIPPYVAHKALVKAGSILVGCTAEPYVSPAHNDKKFDF